jgi:hypothetical protein
LSFSTKNARAVVPGVLLVTWFVAAGCSDEDSTGSLIIEIAATDDETCEVETEDPPQNFACALITVCERVPGESTCTERPVLPCASAEECTAADVSQVGMGPVGNSALVPVDASNDFSFIVQLDEEEVENPNLDSRYLEISTELYDEAGNPLYRAIRTGVPASEFFSQAIAMRAYPFARSACAGPSRDDSLIERRMRDRAFHQAVRLPNGDVLIFGGVRGEAPIDDLGVMSVGSLPQPVVEIYRAQEDRVDVVENTFARVLFSATLLTEDPDAEQYRIYIAGGFNELGTLLRYDVNQNQSQNFYGTPLLIGENATPEPDVILVYDRETNSIEQEIADMETHGAVVADTEPGMTFFPVAGGVTDAALSMGPGTGQWTFVRTNRWISIEAGEEDPSAMRSMGNADRFGHSITLLPELGQAFVWGGNINTTDGTALESTAGQVYRPGGTPPLAIDASSPGSGAPAPTAFHTATSLGGSEVMLIGGLKTGCIGSTAPCGQNGVTTFPADSPVVRLTVGAPGITGVFAYTAQPFDNSVFHVATPLDDGSILMTGGASCTVSGTTGCARRTLYTETDRVYLVTFDDGAVNEPDDDIPDNLLTGRFAHQVTRLDVCPPGTTDCRDPRYLVTGGFRRATDGSIEAIRVAEVILKQRTGSRGPLEFDENCVLEGGDAGVIDSGVPDTGPRDTGVVDTGTAMDSAAGDAVASDAAMDGG